MSQCNYRPSLTSGKLDDEEESKVYKCPTNLSFIESSASGFVNLHSRAQGFEVDKPPNIDHELDVVKSLLQQGSSVTGDNVFDHLVELIKRIISERPTNIVDYFEEFSYNVRAQKFRIPEQFPWANYYPASYAEKAKAFLAMMKLPVEDVDAEYNVCKEEPQRFKRSSLTSFEFDLSPEKYQRKLSMNENVLRLHLYWALCGFELQADETLHLAYALQKIQFHPIVANARFWGKIHGQRKPYYIVEATLTQYALQLRLEKMREEMLGKMFSLKPERGNKFSIETRKDLIPGYHWKDQPEEYLQRMQPPAEPIPQSRSDFQFDIPPEPVGSGLNRKSYFVTNSVTEDWIELPIVTPKQVQVSRQIKKPLTGDLEADIESYPSFPGNEKHYLRTMIARITSGTYIAPEGYYRKLTKQEKLLALGERQDYANAEEEELNSAEEEGDFEIDPMITKNLEYRQKGLENASLKNWVHIRPNILNQGRIVHFDEKKARRALLKGSKPQILVEEEQCEDEIHVEEPVEENALIEEDDYGPESGPPLFTPCSQDLNTEKVLSWTQRYSSEHCKINQLIVMQSNLWPGSYSFSIDNYADSIYMGLGCKYTSRNMVIPQIPPIQDEFGPDYSQEALDPSAEKEEAYRMYEIMNQTRLEEFGEEQDQEESDSC